MYIYQIPATEKGRLGVNICAFIDGDKVLLIDSGYEKDCEQVINELNKHNLQVTTVILTHFHPDHFRGIGLLNHPEIVGSIYGEKTIKRFLKEGFEDYLPTKIIEDGDSFEFGEFCFKFRWAPGHSICSMLIDINKKYLHVGDLYIKTDDGGEVLPYVTWKGLKDHIKAFDIIREYESYIPILSHGICPVELVSFNQGIEDRLIYLNALLKSNNRVTGLEAIKNCSRTFENMKWY